MITPPRRHQCEKCAKHIDRSRLLLLSADALEAAANMERLILMLIEREPAGSAARLMVTEGLAEWHRATKVINRTMHTDIQTEEIFTRLAAEPTEQSA